MRHSGRAAKLNELPYSVALHSLSLHPLSLHSLSLHSLSLCSLCHCAHSLSLHPLSLCSLSLRQKWDKDWKKQMDLDIEKEGKPDPEGRTSLGLFHCLRLSLFSIYLLLFLSQSLCLVLSHCLFLSMSLSFSITCTCCYDEIKGTQDLKIYSHADSQILSLSFSTHFHSLSHSLYTLTLRLSSALHITLVMMRSKEFKISRLVLILIL